jgi:hypothetical protein
LFYGLSAAWALTGFGHFKNPTLTYSKNKPLFYSSLSIPKSLFFTCHLFPLPIQESRSLLFWSTILSPYSFMLLSSPNLSQSDQETITIAISPQIKITIRCFTNRVVQILNRCCRWATCKRELINSLIDIFAIIKITKAKDGVLPRPRFLWLLRVQVPQAHRPSEIAIHHHASNVVLTHSVVIVGIVMEMGRVGSGLC